MIFQFQKRCRVCKAVYYRKDISDEAFAEISDNPNLTIDVSPIIKSATIESICDEHVDSEVTTEA